MNTSMGKEKIREDILNTPYKLFPKQAEAVTSGKRFVRVIAGAGAGKTETLTRRISYLLLHEDCPPRSIVAFTFTKRAAQSIAILSVSTMKSGSFKNHVTTIVNSMNAQTNARTLRNDRI